MTQGTATDDAGSTRSRLIRAAESLFAARGVESVSLREIGRAADARNIAAVQYHFQDRNGLVVAILQKHTPGIARARHRLLDAWETSRARAPRELVAALVRPLAAKLHDDDGGLEYLRIYGELINRPGGIGVPLVEATRNSLERWASLIEPHVEPPGDLLYRRYLVVRLVASELGRRARVRPGRDHRLFVEHLVDVVHAVLGAPAAPETQAITRRRAGLKAPTSAFPVEDREL